MKRIAVLLTLFVLGLSAASFAFAGPPPGKGKGKPKAGSTTSATGSPACKPMVSFVLKGTLVGSPGASSFAMAVLKTNKPGSAFAGTQATIMVDTKTKIRRRGPAQLSELMSGDLLNVKARTCKPPKGAAAGALLPQLTARKIDARPLTGKGKGGTTTTTTTTTP